MPARDRREFSELIGPAPSTQNGNGESELKEGLHVQSARGHPTSQTQSRPRAALRFPSPVSLVAQESLQRVTSHCARSPDGADHERQALSETWCCFRRTKDPCDAGTSLATSHTPARELSAHVVGETGERTSLLRQEGEKGCVFFFSEGAWTGRNGTHLVSRHRREVAC